ncbi:hypothetical protein N431DRAFT_467169 [Stipitochalara longipes BDJ]|nr:hypothetical protein N431DRAFT_467169 [Stipitochalara longipes BDJ]
MKFTISAVVAAVAFFASGTTGTQVNAYHDSKCQQYAYTVYSQQWGCQDISGIEGIDLVNSNAECNVYADTGCQEFQFSYKNRQNQCINIGGGAFGSKSNTLQTGGENVFDRHVQDAAPWEVRYVYRRRTYPSECWQGLGRQFVLFYVGEDADEVAIHVKKLSEYSRLFEETFRLPSSQFLPILQQSLGQSISISEHNGAICLSDTRFRIKDMNAMVEWMYTSSLPATMRFKDFRCLYRLASKFQVPGLLSKLIEHIQAPHKDSEEGFSRFSAKAIHQISKDCASGGGRLWQYCAKHVMGCLVQGKATEEWVKKFKELYSKVPSLREEMFQMILDSAGPICVDKQIEEMAAHASTESAVAQGFAKSKTKAAKKAALMVGNVKAKESSKKKKKEIEKADPFRKSGKRGAASRRSADKKDRQQYSNSSILNANQQVHQMSEQVIIKQES